MPAKMRNSHYFTIAEHNICIRFADGQENTIELLPSFNEFKAETPQGQMLFTLTIDDTLLPRKEKTLVRKFDTGNGDTLVYKLVDGGYQYIIRDIHNRDCCLLICNNRFTECQCALNGDWTMRSFGLNDALMLIYAFAGAFHHTILIHASCIKYGSWGFPFTAKSGTGKSTHTSLWLKYIEGSELLNDDNPIIRIINDQAFIYGSPWSGKTPCYRNMKVRLAAITNISRASENSIERLDPVRAFASLLPACSSMMWDSEIHNNLCEDLTHLIEQLPIYTLHCLPNEEAARLCHKTIVT